MREGTWNAIEAMFQSFPIVRADPVSLHEVQVAEQQLRTLFPDDYREFICRYGGAIVGPYPIFGLRRAEAMARNDKSVVEVTRQFREQQWPGTEGWVVFSIDHAGNPIGFDRDGRVWISDHDFGVVEVTANSFEDYLRKRCLKLTD